MVTAATAKAPADFPWRGKFDRLIFEGAAAANTDPVLVKAVMMQESAFDQFAINPEETYTLNGSTFTAGSRAGRKMLVEEILKGLDPKTINLNPSIGLGQVRVATARDFISGVTARELFDPQTNIRAAASFIAWLGRSGAGLEKIDAYNTGLGAQRRGRRNFHYRDRVNSFYRKFQNDFPRMA